MGNSRDVTLDLIGRDHTGHATRSAANNLDRLRHKMSKFNVDSDSSLKRRFAASGMKAASAFAGSFIRIVSGGLLGKGSVGMAAKLNPVMAAVGAIAGAVVGLKLIAVAGDVILAGLPLVLAAGIAALPFAHIWKQASAATAARPKAAAAEAAAVTRLATARARLAAAEKVSAKMGKTSAGETSARRQLALAEKSLSVAQKAQKALGNVSPQERAITHLKAKWKGFEDFISKPMKLPFVAVLKEVGAGLDRVKGPFASLVKSLGPALAPFTRGVFDSIIAFVKALAPAMPGITAGLKAWGQALPGIGKAFGDMFANILRDPDRVVTAVNNVASIIEFLILWLGRAVRAATMMGDAITLVWRSLVTEAQMMAIGSVKALSHFLDAWATINPLMRGPAAAVRLMLHGMQTDFQKTANKWTATQQAIAKRVIVAKLRADKTDLEAKIAAAKRRLHDPDLTKERKAKIKADIAKAQASLASIKAQLARLDGTTANTYVNVHRNTSSKDAAAGPARPSGKHSGGADWLGAAGGSYRIEPPRVVMGDTTNITRVFLDSREIRSVARTAVLDEKRRSAFAARVGRR